MIDPSIKVFFQDRKETWLKKTLNSSMNDAEIEAKNRECEDIFSLENWLPNAAKRAGQISLSTHPCTFSHPSARKNNNGYASPIIAKKVKTNDGYLRSGNVVVEADALGNAAAIDVYKFLTLEMQDGKTLLHHIEHDTECAKDVLTIKSEAYEVLKSGFLSMVQDKDEVITSAKIKQVYFPVDNDYHLLSILTASGVIYEMKKRINDIRFSEETKAARDAEKKGEIYENGYRQITDITVIGYGGTKPQNISVLNNQNAGKAYLLPSMPPSIKVRTIQFPTVDFFKQTLNYSYTRELFQKLHKLFKSDENNMNVRAQRDFYYLTILDHIIERMCLVREVFKEPFNVSSNLNKTQKVWLCHEYEDSRNTDDEWLDDLTKQISHYFFDRYVKVLDKKAIMFSDAEFKHVHKLITKEREALR